MPFPRRISLLVKVVFFDAVPETAFIDKAVRVAVDGHGVGSVGLQLDRVRAGFLCSVDDFNRTVVVLQMVRRHFCNDKDRGVCGDSAPAQINFLIHIVILSPSFSDI